MTTVTLGKTGIEVIKNGFGALPIQRISDHEAVKILNRAYDGGIRFFDTARFYTDSEKKLGLAFSQIRDKVYIASKTMAQEEDGFWSDLETTLSELNCDYVDLYQFHNPPFCPKPGDGSGLYEAMKEAKSQGKIRHIGITSHKFAVAEEAISSGLYETLQFPLNYLATEREIEIVEKCKQADMGFIAMKGMSGGLITDSRAAYAYLMQFPDVLPVWGVQKMSELEEFLSYNENPPIMNEEIKEIIKKDRAELSGDFCRGCGYCMASCPAKIDIATCARMSLLLRRSPSELQLTEAVQAKMAKIDDCIMCGKCRTRCPYGLDTPSLLERNYKDYKEVLAGKPL